MLLALCKAILNMYYYGFTFHNEFPAYNCQWKTISFKQRHCDESKSKCWGRKEKHPKKKLFRCPRLQYNDLETDKIIVVPLDHYLSDSSLPGSYVSYLAENGAIFPYKYAYNVNVEKIGTELEDKHGDSIVYKAYDDATRRSIFLAIKNVKELEKSE